MGGEDGMSEKNVKKTLKKKSIKKKKVDITAPKSKSGGRPSNFGKVNQSAVKLLCEHGFTDEQMIACLHVSEKTWNLWKSKNKDFYEKLKDWKLQADAKVEASLYERAKGYAHPETKVQWVNDVDGGRWETIQVEKQYPPDPTSMIFWLKNRQPSKYRDKVDHEHSGNMNINVIDYSQLPESPPDGDNNS